METTPYMNACGLRRDSPMTSGPSSSIWGPRNTQLWHNEDKGYRRAWGETPGSLDGCALSFTSFMYKLLGQETASFPTSPVQLSNSHSMLVYHYWIDHFGFLQLWPCSTVNRGINQAFALEAVIKSREGHGVLSQALQPSRAMSPPPSLSIPEWAIVDGWFFHLRSFENLKHRIRSTTKSRDFRGWQHGHN